MMAEPKRQEFQDPDETQLYSIVVFRLGEQWLAFRTQMVREIVDTLPPHRLPHCRDPRLAGLINVRGELVPCVHIAVVLGLPASAVQASNLDTAGMRDQSGSLSGGSRRALVLEFEGQTIACWVDQVYSVLQVAQQSFVTLPLGESGISSELVEATLQLPVGVVSLIAGDLFWYAQGRAFQ